ncbi:MAG TPA: glutathione peroxidase [Puia sp.]|nr:glutathione peroxidase [Puia sp.]
MNSKLKYSIIVLILLMVGFYIWIEAANRNSKHMTGRQKLLKAFYPVLMGAGKLFGSKQKIKMNKSESIPPVSFYSLKALANNGTDISFDQFKGKKVLLVNTASDCGFTPQYDDLQRLYDQQKDKLVIIGFPANDFGEQEKGNDEEIASFCKINYGVSFPLAKKSIVLKGPEQNKVFEWLSNKKENGWNDQEPTWNFSKYLINEKGELTHYFDPSVSPMSKEVLEAIQQ